MEINRRVQDLTEVFDRNYNVNQNNKGRQEFLDGRREHFKKVYGIKDKKDYRDEVLRANSVKGQVDNLNSRMQAFGEGQRAMNRNNFKNNFR